MVSARGGSTGASATSLLLESGADRLCTSSSFLPPPWICKVFFLGAIHRSVFSSRFCGIFGGVFVFVRAAKAEFGSFGLLSLCRFL